MRLGKEEVRVHEGKAERVHTNGQSDNNKKIHEKEKEEKKGWNKG